MSHHYTLHELTEGLSVEIRGDAKCVITGVAPIQEAQAGELSFLSNASYKKYLADTRASAVIVTKETAADCKTNAIITDNPYYIYAKIANHFIDKKILQSGIHPSATIGIGTTIHESASIQANAVIGDHVTIGAKVVVGPGCIIENHVVIGDESILDARVVLYHHVQLGKRVRIYSGAVIGSPGFGLAMHQGSWVDVPQLGRVLIGNDVLIGANTCVDRGALGDTVIEDGVKLDNLIQIAHNVRIGAHTAIAGCVAIAGSTSIGKYCMVGGCSAIAGHLEIADRVVLTGKTDVTRSISEPGIYSSGIVGAVPNQEFRKNNARFHRLGQWIERIKSLETKVKSLLEREINHE